MDLLCLFCQSYYEQWLYFEYSNDNLFTFLNNLGEKILCPSTFHPISPSSGFCSEKLDLSLASSMMSRIIDPELKNPS